MKLSKLTSSLVLILLIACSASAASLSSTSCPGSGCVVTNTSDKGSASFQIGGTWVGTLQFEVTSDDTLGYKALPVKDVSSVDGTLVTEVAANGLYVANVAGFLRVRVRFSAYTSGSATVTTRVSTATQSTFTNIESSGGGGGGGAVTQSGTWTMQPGNTANTTAWLVTGTGGVFPSTQSGTWTVQPGNTANTTAWLSTIKDIKDSAGDSIIDATNDALKVIGANTGATPVLGAGITNTAFNVSSAAAILDSINCFNPNGSASYIQLFNTASPTIGTTTPDYSFGIAANDSLVVTDSNLEFTATIRAAATTAATNGTAPGSAVNCSFGKR